MQAGDHFWQAFVIFGQAPEARRPRQRSAPPPSAAASSTKPRLASGSLTTSSRMPCAPRPRRPAAPRCSPGRRRPVPPSARSPPAPRRPAPATCSRSWALAGVTSSASRCAEGVDGQVDLAALAPFVPVVAGAMPALRRRLPRGAVENGRRRLVGAARRPAQQRRAGRAPSPRRPRRRASAGSAGRRPPTAASRRAGSATGAPVRTIQRRALKTSRRSWRRCGASSRHQRQVREPQRPTPRHSRPSGRACGRNLSFPSPKPTKSTRQQTSMRDGDVPFVLLPGLAGPRSPD